MIITYKSTPKLVVLLTGMTILGAFFPVYGIPFGPIKLTVFRLGVFPLVITQLATLFKDNKRLTTFFVLFFFMRMFSLVWAEDISNGIKQLDWFFEGCCLLFSANAAFNKYSDFGNVFFKLVVFIGAISISFLFLQALCYFGFGYKLYVPFTQNIPEIAVGEQYWNYPIYGAGRIVGSFYEPNMSGSMCSYYFALLLPFLTSNRRKISKLLLVPMLLIVISSLFTGSRQSVVCIVIVLVIYFYYFTRNKIRVLMSLLFVSILVTIFAIQYWDTIAVFFEESDNVISRFDSEAGGDISGGRIDFMKDVWNNYDLISFIFGVGEGVTYGGGHNVFLAVFVENGIFTLFVFIIMLWKLWKSSFTNYKKFPSALNISSCLLVISWVFLMFVNWAQLNQSLSYVYLCFVFLSISKNLLIKEQIVSYNKSI